MSWHISQALLADFENSHSSPGREGVFSAGTCSDGARSAPSSGNPTPQLYLPKDRMTAFSRLSRFGMTFGLLTDDLGGELLTWFLAGFPVRTSAQQGGGQVSQGNAQDSGKKWPESLAKWDPALLSWKTRQFSLLGDSELYSETWPRWGTTRNGESFQQPTPELRTSGNGFGFWPTPVETLWKNGKSGKGFGPNLTEAVKMWPTPDANMGARGTQPEWVPTRKSGQTAQYTINQAVRDSGGAKTLQTYPTPTARDWKSGTGADHGQHSPPLSSAVQGQLNPEWVELLMGWPKCWTDLHPLAKEEFDAWKAGFLGQELPELREKIQAEDFSERKERGFQGVSESSVLLPSLCQFQDGCKEGNFFMESKATQKKRMRSLRGNEEIGSPPLRPRSDKQQPEQSSNSLLLVPQFLARYGKKAWESGRWENAVDRVASNIPARVDRLSAIGNGQVPAVVRLAWETLT